MDAHTPYIADEIPPSLRVTLGGGTTLDLRADNTHVEQRIPLTLAPGRNAVGLSFLDEGSPAIPADAESPLYIRDLRLASGRSFDATVGITEVPDTGFRHLANSAELAVVNPGRETVRDELVFRCYRLYRHDNIPRFYRAGVRSFDRSFGRLVDELRLRGRWDDAVVVFVSDHGEMLGEHDAWGHVEHLWEESLRVPLVVKGPGLERGTASSTRLDLLDLHDLVLALAGGDGSTVDRLTTPSREKTIVGATYPPESGVLQATAIRGPFKVVVDADGAERAFDLDNDRAEAVDILARAQQDPHIRDLLAAARDELAAATEVESLDLSALSAEERDRLRALGYLHTDP
jgi:hypothetical protein